MDSCVAKRVAFWEDQPEGAIGAYASMNRCRCSGVGTMQASGASWRRWRAIQS
jgi:hypothetical protein